MRERHYYNVFPILFKVAGVISIYFVVTLLLPYFSFNNDNSSSLNIKSIVVLGGGLSPDGTVPPHTKLRLERAVELYHKFNKKAIIFTLSGGTPHKPNPVDKYGFPYLESSSASIELIKMGVPADSIQEEAFTIDTIGNAYYFRSVHAEYCDNNDIYIITNNWHMPRSQAIFEYVFSLPYSIDSNKKSNLRSRKFQLHFEPVDAGVDEEVGKARRIREQQSLKTFNEKTKKEFNSMQSFHDWLFTKHIAYAAIRHTIPRNENLDKETLKTY